MSATQFRTFSLLFSISILFSSVAYSADHILTFFIFPYPEKIIKKPVKVSTDFLFSPHILTTMLKNNSLSSTSGIIGLYGGYFSISSMSGQLTFPLMQQKPEFLLLITPFIRPIFMLESTVHHWEILPTLPAKAYLITRKQDPSTKLWYWEVKSTELPKKNIIPLNAIVILAKPKNIVVPLGVTLASNSYQMMLPPIYAYPNLNRVNPALELLKIKNFFSSIKHATKKIQDTTIATQIVTQTLSK